MDTQVDGFGLKHVRELTNLKVLNLCGTRVTDSALENVNRLTNLGELDLSNTLISDAGLTHLRGLAGLGSLDLSMTKVKGSGLKHLRGTVSLNSLDLVSRGVENRPGKGALKTGHLLRSLWFAKLGCLQCFQTEGGPSDDESIEDGQSQCSTTFTFAGLVASADRGTPGDSPRDG
jgi:hypothetical protein